MDILTDWYALHLISAAGWMVLALYQFIMELLAWARPKRRRGTAKAAYYVNMFLVLPVLSCMLLSGIALFVPENLVFPTYNIMFISFITVIAVSLWCFILVHKRKNEEGETRYSRLIRVSFLISIPAFLLGSAAELHIWNNWLDYLFSFIPF